MLPFMNHIFHVAKHLIGLLVVAMLTGCTIGPDYVRPDVSLPAAWQATLPHGGRYGEMAEWWKQFNDATLTEMQASAQSNSPSLDKAAAAIRSARSSITISRAAGLPSLSAGATTTRTGEAGTSGSAATTTSNGIDASWELDLFGGVRRSVEAAKATLSAKEADWHDARISLSAEVAVDYVDYRACRIKQSVYQDQSLSYRETQRSTRASVDAGFSAPADLALAEAGAASASSSAIAQEAACEVGVKSLVAITGLSETYVRQMLGTGKEPIPNPSEATLEVVPATLVTQRPDVISAERQLASAMAKIGVAEANRWPAISVTGSIYVTHALGASTTPWSLVPALSVPLFNGGALSAKVEIARADYDTAFANYKSTVRNAIKEVETVLVNLDSTVRREQDARTSARQYQVYFKAAEINWLAGRISLLDLEIARRSALSAEIALVELNQNRITYWIQLYKALGGAWKSSQNSEGVQ